MRREKKEEKGLFFHSCKANTPGESAFPIFQFKVFFEVSSSSVPFLGFDQSQKNNLAKTSMTKFINFILPHHSSWESCE